MLGEVAYEEPELRIDSWLDLSGITFELAATLESLAPFGTGNEKPILATRDLTMHSAKMIGRNKEHMKLYLSDKTGNGQTVFWWNGAGETLPEGRFDLAYTVRTSDWRGKRQVQIVLVNFRIIEAPAVEITSQKQEILDYRNSKDPFILLKYLQNQPSTLIWAEAEAKKETGGKDRYHLDHVDNLVIWTIPPSPGELQIALETVKPRVVTLVGADPSPEASNVFLEHLTGLLKYAITHRTGKVTYSELAAATAQRRITVEQGVSWLVAGGKITLVHQEEDILWIASSDTIKDQGSQARLKLKVQALLTETAAYRTYFQKADPKSLLYPSSE